MDHIDLPAFGGRAKTGKSVAEVRWAWLDAAPAGKAAVSATLARWPGGLW